MKFDLAFSAWFVTLTVVLAYAVLTDLPQKSRADNEAYQFSVAAQKACGGDNAVWELLAVRPDGKVLVQCLDKRGRKTGKVIP